MLINTFHNTVCFPFVMPLCKVGVRIGATRAEVAKPWAASRAWAAAGSGMPTAGTRRFRGTWHPAQVKPGRQGSLAELLYCGRHILPCNRVVSWEGGGDFATAEVVACSGIWLVPRWVKSRQAVQGAPQERPARAQIPSEIGPRLSSRQRLQRDSKGCAGTASSQAALKANQNSTNYLH